MDFISKDRILEFKQDSLEYIRKQHKLDKPGQMQEAINVLRHWVQKQSHFKRKDIGERYCELTIIACKGSIERAKRQIDKICTYRTLLPQYFGAYHVQADLCLTTKMSCSLILPKMMDNYYRVVIMNFKDKNIKGSDLLNFYRYIIILGEYVIAHDYANGYLVIIDFSEADVMEYIAEINLVELRQMIVLFIEGFGMRIKSFHIITPSKLIDVLISIFKQALNPKVAGRIKAHKSITEIYEYVPKSILPKDYGGEQQCLRDLQDEWFKALSSEEHLNYLNEINQFCTDENYRQGDKFNDEYAGTPGSFRSLSVD